MTRVRVAVGVVVVASTCGLAAIACVGDDASIVSGWERHADAAEGGASSPSAGLDAGGDAESPLSDAGGRLRCGTSMCRAPGQICCGSGGYDTPPLAWDCVDPSPTACPEPTTADDAGLFRISLGCSSAASCKGASESVVCCALHESPGGRVSRTTCTVASACTGPERGVVCDPAVPSCSGNCAAGPFNFTDYFECQ